MPQSTQQSQRLKKQKQVKSKIQQILQSVKQQKQHIQNKLATNDQKIQLYCDQYQNLKKQNDFGHLTEQEEIILSELQKGLYENGILAKEIIGGKEVGLRDKEFDEGECKKIDNKQIIEIQALMIDKLAKRIKELEKKQIVQDRLIKEIRGKKNISYDQLKLSLKRLNGKDQNLNQLDESSNL